MHKEICKSDDSHLKVKTGYIVKKKITLFGFFTKNSYYQILFGLKW